MEDCEFESEGGIGDGGGGGIGRVLPGRILVIFVVILVKLGGNSKRNGGLLLIVIIDPESSKEIAGKSGNLLFLVSNIVPKSLPLCVAKARTSCEPVK